MWADSEDEGPGAEGGYMPKIEEWEPTRRRGGARGGTGELDTDDEPSTDEDDDSEESDGGGPIRSLFESTIRTALN